MKWIPVSDRLPDTFASVLVCVPSFAPLPTVREAYLVEEDTWFVPVAMVRANSGEVTHWMPMPNTEEIRDGTRL